MNPIFSTIQRHISHNFYKAAWECYKPIILSLARGKKVLELGAGRSPLFTEQELKEYQIHYTANDIWQSELDRIPFQVAQACFDATQTIPNNFYGQFDLVFSRMVQEHVRDGKKFYQNLAKLLVPGGVALNFHPVLYHPVFILNYLLPEDFSSRLLRSFFPNRNWEGSPKFPAFYQDCTALAGQAAKLKSYGFTDATQFVFYGQYYLDKIPVLRTIAQLFDKTTQRLNLRLLATYAYSVVIK